jgi:hypothetical protein
MVMQWRLCSVCSAMFRCSGTSANGLHKPFQRRFGGNVPLFQKIYKATELWNTFTVFNLQCVRVRGGVSASVLYLWNKGTGGHF